MIYTEDNIRELTIYKLRDIARNIGVKAPTTKKRDELIEEILKIQNGELMPYNPTKKVGRPAKMQEIEIANIEQAILCFDNDNDANCLSFCDSKNSYGCDTNKKYFETQGFLFSPDTKEHYLMNYQGNMSLQRIAWIPNKLIDKNRMRVGNLLTIQAINRITTTMPMASMILEIEGQQFKGFKRDVFESKPTSLDKQYYTTCADLVLNYGERILISGNKFDIMNLVLNLLNQSYDYCQSIILLALNCTLDKAKELSEQKNMTVFTSLFSDTSETQFTAYKLAFEHAKRQSELGKRAILVVTDLDKLYDNLKMNEESKNMSLKSLYGLARNFEDVGSLTVIGTCSSEFYESTKDFKVFIDAHIKQVDGLNLIGENLKENR